MRSRTFRALTTTAATAGVLALTATVAAAETHEVQPGDTLSSIAAESDTVDTWRDLVDLNQKLDDPNLILPGQELALSPESADEASPAADPAPAAPAEDPAPVEAPAPAEEPAPEPASSSTDAGVWDRLAECESSGDWSIDTGNGYYGGLQFALSSWEWVGGSGYPHEASKDEQIARAEILLERQGWNAWPACGDQLGLR